MNKLLIIGLLCAAGANANDRFGSKGTISPSGSVGAHYSSTPGSAAFSATSDYGGSLDPGVMYFVSDGLALGGVLHLSYDSLGISGASSRIADLGYGIAPAIGYNLWVGSTVSLFPQVSVRLSWDRFISEANFLPSHLVTFQAFVPVLFHVTPHFFLGAGPALSRDLANRAGALVNVSSGGQGIVPVEVSLNTTLSLQSVIGGWF
ncbi:MAG TPA: hypothetical protein VGH20_14345 [Myxococcales bacterium]|jgi:hypothetical protein